MHGLILTSFRDYLATVHGTRLEKEIWRSEPVYLISEAYPDEQFFALVRRACDATRLERRELLHELGVYTAEVTFARLYPALFAVSPTCREFLLTVEKPIHEVVRTAMPSARPPELAISELDGNSVSIVYTSSRRLCEFLTGLVQGTAQHYEEVVQIDEGSCMHRGESACTFEIRFEPPV